MAEKIYLENKKLSSLLTQSCPDSKQQATSHQPYVNSCRSSGAYLSLLIRLPDEQSKQRDEGHTTGLEKTESQDAMQQNMNAHLEVRTYLRVIKHA